MKIIPFIKKIVVGFLLVQSQASVMAEEPSDCAGVNDEPFNPCEAFGFHLVAGKASRNTTRWMLGEFHSYAHMTTQCLTELINLPGKTTIYYEGFDYEEERIDCPSELKRKLKKGSKIECYGWDDMEVQYDDSLKDPLTNALGALIEHRDFFIKNKLTDDQFDRIVRDTKEKAYVGNQDFYGDVPERFLEKKVASDKMLFDWLQDERRSGKSYHDIFTKYIKMTQVSFEFSSITIEGVDKRNKRLIKTIREHKHDHRAVVIAGAQHLFPTYEEPDPSTRQYVKRELERDAAKKGVSYAILQFKP